MALSTEEIQNTKSIDPETGLPALPENYFWDISYTGEKSGLIVRLKKNRVRQERQSHWLFWEKLVDVPEVDQIDYEYIFVEKDDGDTLSAEEVQAAILEKAKYIVKGRRVEWDRSELLAPFVGKYPPKNLNQL